MAGLTIEISTLDYVIICSIFIASLVGAFYLVKYPHRYLSKGKHEINDNNIKGTRAQGYILLFLSIIIFSVFLIVLVL